MDLNASAKAFPTALGRDDWDEHWRAFAATAKANPAQTYRRNLVLASLAMPKRGTGARVIDIGSGIGCMLDEIGSRASEAALLGVELSRSGIAVAQRRLPGAHFLQHDLTQHVEISRIFRRWATHAICSEVLEHIEDPVAFLREAAGYMAPGCRLVVTVPGGPRSAFDMHIGHRRHFTADQLRQVLECAGFVVERVDGAGFPMFNLYRLVVCWRGTRLIDDVQGPPGWAARSAMAIFSWLFRMNLRTTCWGWQIIGIARRPPVQAGEG